MQPELTVAIPTYNRINSLKQSLKLAIKYFKEKNVEVFVSDNASTDGTQKYMTEIRSIYPEIKYYRNEKNLGLDGNFLNCFNKAKGKYLFILSDDDYLLPGASEDIFKAIKREPVFIHLNTSGIVSQNPLKYGKPRFVEKGLIEIEDKNIFLQYVGIYISFVSSLIFNVELVQSICNKEKYYGGNLLLSHIALRTMKKNGKYIIITRNCLAATGNITVGYDVYDTWIKEFSRVMLITGCECGFEISVLNKILHRELATIVLDFVLYYRQTCSNEKMWNLSSIWTYIEKYPDLTLFYKLALYTSISKLDKIKTEIINRKIELIVQFAKKFDNIYFYGAGENAKYLYKCLKDMNISIKGFLVTDNPVNFSFCGLPMYQFRKRRLSSEIDGIIVTMALESQLEIIPMLEKSGFKKNVYFQDIRR
ncbi:glycosyltransferase family 2 protein [Pectinatus haikarae]|uniref:glycosyltransferase family 2 protein n=1 Tax=Pectinatus haikarae TaxID=349096 RepID=UPI0018C7E63F|nr:glycosyltransferase family 2 protein [Pectinatus haikarae]